MLRTECTVGKRVIADSGPATIVGEGRQDNEIFVYLDDEHLIGTFHCEDLEPLVIKDSDPVIFEGLWDPLQGLCLGNITEAGRAFRAVRISSHALHAVLLEWEPGPHVGAPYTLIGAPLHDLMCKAIARLDPDWKNSKACKP